MEVNYLAVLLSGIGSMVLGFVWYGPLLGNLWMKESGLTEKDVADGPGLGYLYTFIAAMVMAAVTSSLVKSVGIDSMSSGLTFGLMIGVGYIGTSFASNYIFGQRSLKLYLIDAGYQILNVTLAALITTWLG